MREGWNEADSLVINPHKMLFVPFDFSALYVREIARLRNVFTLVPDYLRGDAAGAEINYMDYGVQLGRKFRALKAWMVWRTFGRAGIAAPDSRASPARATFRRMGPRATTASSYPRRS